MFDLPAPRAAAGISLRTWVLVVLSGSLMWAAFIMAVLAVF